MKFIVDRNIRGAEHTFGKHGEIVRMDGRDIRREHLGDADALIIRTATRVDETLLRGTPVGFVGTTSIGKDHLDIPWLAAEGISWASAPGCNADSAAQYTLAMAWLACRRAGLEPGSLSAGIIGRGNVGSRVQRLFETLGMRTVANDPPLQQAGETGLVSLDEALAQDIVCLHVPLTREGPWPTERMIAAPALSAMREGALLINAARGDVVAGGDLLQALAGGRLRAALDVWPGEPMIDARLLEAATVATPHVAGYSDEGKRNGSWTVYQSFCHWADLPAGERPARPDGPCLDIARGEDALDRALSSACFVQEHDRAMKALTSFTVEERALAFDGLRRDYPERRDFQAWRVRCEEAGHARLLAALGFDARCDG